MIDYNYIMPLGTQITAWRCFHNLTQAALAERAGLTRPYVCRLEGGDADPALSSLRRLAVALGITVGQLLEEAPRRKALNRHELDRLARGSINPGAQGVLEWPEIRGLARVVSARRQALGLYKPRKPGRAPAKAGKFTLRSLKARLGQDQWDALMRRIDKLASLQARRP